MAKRKSAFVKAGDSNKDAVKNASKTTRSNNATAEDIIESLNLSAGQRASVVCTCQRIICDVHDDDKGDKAGLPYVNFVFEVQSGPLAKASISQFMPCYDRRSLEITEDAMEWIFREFQGLGYDTEGWTLADVEAKAEEAAEDKPSLTLSVSCAAIKSGRRKGELAVNTRIGRLLDTGEGAATTAPDDDDDDGGNDDGAVASDDSSDQPSFKVGDKVSYDYEDEDGNVETLTCVVKTIDEDSQTLKINDGEYDYPDVPFDEVAPV